TSLFWNSCHSATRSGLICTIVTLTSGILERSGAAAGAACFAGAAGALFDVPLCCAIVRAPLHARETATTATTTSRLAIRHSLPATRASRERTIVGKDAFIRPAR